MACAMPSTLACAGGNNPLKTTRPSSSKFPGQKGFAFFLVCLWLSSLACAQAGEILTPAEATARASIPTATPTARQDVSVATATPADASDTPDQGTKPIFQEGQEVYLVGKGYLINLLDIAAGTRIVGSQERGAKVTVREVIDLNGQVWVRIQAPTGEGWIKVENLSQTGP